MMIFRYCICLFGFFNFSFIFFTAVYYFSIRFCLQVLLDTIGVSRSRVDLPEQTVVNHPVTLSAPERETYSVLQQNAVEGLTSFYAEGDKDLLPYLQSLLVMLRQFSSESPTFERIDFQGTCFLYTFYIQ